MKKNKTQESKGKAYLGIKSRLVLSIIALFVVSSLTLGLISYKKSSSMLISSAKENMTSQVKNSADILTSQFKEITKSIEIISRQEEIASMDWDRQREICFREKDKLGVKALEISKPNGDTHTTNSDAVFNLKGIENFDLAISGTPNVTSPIFSEANGELIIIITVPIFDGGNVVGTLGATIDADAFQETVASMNSGESGYSYVLNENGQVIAHKDIDFVYDGKNFLKDFAGDKEYSSFVSTQQNMVNGKEGSEDYKVLGKTSYISYCPVEDLGWSIATIIPESEVLAPVKALGGFLLVATIISIIIAVALIYIIASSIVNPVKKIIKVTNELASGNLDVKLEIDRKDEIGDLEASLCSLVARLHGYIDYIQEISALLRELGNGKLNLEFSLSYDGEFEKLKSSLGMTTKMLGEMIGRVKETADQVRGSAQDVSSGSQALAQGATEQASSIEELSATINEITSQVQATAKNADDAREASEKSSLACDEGKAKMEEMVGAMNEISETSGQIGKIIKNIEDIAFQTNILALNAAVEAARAGAAGKGFSVVAEEVRNLAAKSAESAKDTARLIESALEAVEGGSRVAGETVKALERVIDGTRETADLIDSIAEASARQADAIAQINIGIEQVACVVQQNSETAERSASSTDTLINNSDELTDIIGGFEL